MTDTKIIRKVEIEEPRTCKARDINVDLKCPVCDENLKMAFGKNYLKTNKVGIEHHHILYCVSCTKKGDEEAQYYLPIKVLSITYVIEYDRDRLKLAD